MLLGDARTWDERGLDIETTKHRVLYGKRICDERTANRRGARIEAFGRGQIRESEERPLVHKQPEHKWREITTPEMVKATSMEDSPGPLKPQVIKRIRLPYHKIKKPDV